jgi:hypothetical protein
MQTLTNYGRMFYNIGPRCKCSKLYKARVLDSIKCGKGKHTSLFDRSVYDKDKKMFYY